MAQVEIAQRSARGSLSLFVGNLGSALISFVAIVFIARYLGPGQYGTYALAVLVPNLLLNVLGFGVNSGITRYAAYNLSQGRPEVARRMSVNGALFILLFGLALAAVCFVLASPLASFVLHRPSMTSLVAFASLLVFSQSVYQSGTSALLGWSLMGDIAGTVILQSAIRLMLAVPLILLGFAVYGALGAFVSSTSIAGVVAFALLFRRMGGGRRGLEAFADDVRVMLGYGRELFLGQFAAGVTPQYVVAILAVVASNAYVGYYQSASNFATIISLTSSAMTSALFPAFAHLEGTGSDLGRAFSHATKYMAFLMAPVIFLLAGAAKQMVGVAFGPSYSISSEYLTLLAFSNIVLLFGSGVLSSFFSGVGTPRLYTISSVMGALILAALAPGFAIAFGLGVPGLIYSILVSNVIATVIGLGLASRFLKATLDLRACISILMSSVLAFLAVYSISFVRASDFLLLPLQVIIFALVYLTASPLLGAVVEEDLNVLDSTLAGLGAFEKVFRPTVSYERRVLRLKRGRAS